MFGDQMDQLYGPTSERFDWIKELVAMRTKRFLTNCGVGIVISLKLEQIWYD